LNAQDTNWPHPDWSRHLHRSDLHGVVRLGVAAVAGMVDVVQDFHMGLIGPWLAASPVGRISGRSYAAVRWSAQLTGNLIERALDWPGYAGAGDNADSSAERDAVLAALNGFIGDQLEADGNPLAIRMSLRRGGRPLALTRAALARDIAQPSRKIVVLVHGLGRTDLQWRRQEHDHGAALGERLGYTPLYVHYNSGRHISQNGRDLARLLEDLFRAWPVKVDEIAIVGHSMGGLVARSACHYAVQERYGWVRRLRHLAFLGTPHHGAPLEQSWNLLVELIGSSALVAPIARLARLRSAGITDLRYGNLVDEDWQGRNRFEARADERTHVPLPQGVHCYTIAGTTGRRRGDFRDRLLGDGVIPLDTALGRHADDWRSVPFPEEHQWIAFGVHHLDLLSRREVYDQLEAWLAATDQPATRVPYRFRRPARRLTRARKTA
jgi:hypothetical protein